ncbi:MAG: thiamine pyrophosphate-dependent dehydrogenase E1 component subunit alpha [Elusimicrobia bacterium]|nr:thiamine pyrophosphate-dependent dehydrogenase E1 component subunit alpha [Elusimicrobiota bacterium]
MLRIRKVEDKIVELYPRQEMKCPTHLSIGQEAVAVGVSAALKQKDHAYSGHRCHAHYLAKGGAVAGLFAELYGKSSGCARGFGGSMHLVALEVGLVGSSAIVGGTIPIAAGSALAFKMRKLPYVAVAYFGDAGVEQGVFYESYLFAALKSLPVVYICENNGYATQSPLANRQPPGPIINRVKRLGGHVAAVDGNNVLCVYLAAKKAIAYARQGRGPAFLECRTYRWLEHVGTNFDYHLGYRTKNELEQWMKYCPVAVYKNWLLKNKLTDETALKNMEAEIGQEINDALAAAKSGPPADPAVMAASLYA